MKTQPFSLIELLVVIAILGALVSMVLPSFNNVQDDARDKVMRTEMREIQNQFRRFSTDTNTKGATKLEDIANYGLWPLLAKDHPDNSVTTISYRNYGDISTGYDPEIGLGRKGPYLEREGTVTIDAASFASTPGQAEATSGTMVDVPVIKDPYGGYYRIMMPAAGTSTDREKRIVLVCTGLDTTLDTSIGTDSEIAKSNDDYVIRLLPLSTW